VVSVLLGITLIAEALMVQATVTDADRVRGYLAAAPKYVIAPIPTPLERGVAIQAVNDGVRPGQPVEIIRKLVDLAIFYDLRETAPAMQRLLNRGETQSDDFARSALAVIALAWIGDTAQLAAVQEYFRALQERAPVDIRRVPMLEAAATLGTREALGNYRRWVEREIARLQARVSLPGGDGAAQMQIDELEEHLLVNVAAVEKAGDVRRTVEALPLAEKIPALAALYIGDATQTNPDLRSWAAMTLVRLPAQANAAPHIAEAFVQLARRYQAGGARWQAQFDIYRARALRAAVFFGRQLASADQQWLAAREDPGVELLALRPDWKYAPTP
jgi:hypothetical protein